MRGRRARFSRSPADDDQAAGGWTSAAHLQQQRVSAAIPELHAKAATLLKFVKTTRRSGDKMKGERPGFLPLAAAALLVEIPRCGVVPTTFHRPGRFADTK